MVFNYNRTKTENNNFINSLSNFQFLRHGFDINIANFMERINIQGIINIESQYYKYIIRFAFTVKTYVTRVNIIIVSYILNFNNLIIRDIIFRLKPFFTFYKPFSPFSPFLGF